MYCCVNEVCIYHVKQQFCSGFILIITKTRQNNFDPLTPHFYIVKLGFTGVDIIFLILLKKKHRLWVLVRKTKKKSVIFPRIQSAYI